MKSGWEHRVHSSYNLRQTISRTFQGFLKDKLQFSRTKIYSKNWHSLTPLLNTLLAKMRHGVIYDFNFFSHHRLFTLFNTTFHNNILQMTGNDLMQLHLRSKNCIWNKEKLEIKYCSNTKMFLSYLWVSGVHKVVNFKDFSRPNKEIKYFSKTLTKFKELFKTTTKIQDLLKIVWTMRVSNKSIVIIHLPLRLISTHLTVTFPRRAFSFSSR